MIDEKVANLMYRLKISEEEALQLIEDDKAIDRGAKMFELEGELAEGAKKARRADRKPNSTPTKREKKENNEKRFLINSILEGLGENAENIQITNPEREFSFVHNGTKYKIVMSCPRS
jgi:hypothetical protein